MNINLTKKTRLLTKDKVCRENIDIIPSLQEKSVTTNGIVVPDSGFVGLNKVTVNVPEVAGNVMASIDNPRMPKLGRLKYFRNYFTELGYMDMQPCSENFGVLGVSTKSSGFSGQTAGEVLASLYNNFGALPQPVSHTNNGDNIQFGYAASNLSARWYQIMPLSATAPQIYIPPFTCKVAVYKSGEVAQTEYSFDNGITFNESAQSGDIALAYHLLTIGCNTSGGLIVAAEFEYPKANVTFSGTSTAGLQYRIAESGEFTNITNGLALKQVEHITVRTTGTSGKLLTSDSGAIYSILVGRPLTIPVTANTTLTIS